MQLRTQALGHLSRNIHVETCPARRCLLESLSENALLVVSSWARSYVYRSYCKRRCYQIKSIPTMYKVCVVPVRHARSTYEAHLKYSWGYEVPLGTPDLPVKVCSTLEAKPKYPWECAVPVRHTQTTREENFFYFPFIKSLKGTADVPHWYCTPSRVLYVCLTSTSHLHRYFGCALWVLHTLTGPFV